MKALIAASIALGLSVCARAVTFEVDASAPGPGSAPVLPAGLSHEAFPVVAEMSYAETPSAEWPAELAKIRAAGVDIVVSPVIWRYHEAAKGTFAWNGDLDVGLFAKECAQAHLTLILRPVFYAEREMPNGGAPDWLNGFGNAAPGQLAQEARPFFASMAGSFAKAQSLDTLVAFQWGVGLPVPVLIDAAKQAGLTPPVTLTANVERAQAEALHAYPLDLYRIATSDPAAHSSAQPATFQFRDSHSAQAGEMLEVGAIPSYIRRPFIDTGDVDAAAIVALGSGSPLAWYQRFHGGIRYDPVRPRTLVDSPSSRPLLNADSQAPLAASGGYRTSYGYLKELNTFLHDFGRDLGGMPSFVPQASPFPWAVRTNGRSGFLFVSNYGREQPMPDRQNVQFQVKLPGETLVIPMLPIRIPMQTAFVWPINLQMGTIKLKYATAQPLARLGSWFVFLADDIIPAEFMFDRATLSAESDWHIAGLTPDVTTTFQVTSKNGATAHILVLKSGQGTLAWRTTLKGRPHLVLTAPLTTENDTLHVTLSPGHPTPLLIMPEEDFGIPHVTHGPFTMYTLKPGPKTGLLPPIEFNHDKDRTALEADILHARPPNTMQFNQAQYFSMRLPPEDVNPERHATLVIPYQGDCARLYLGNKMISDSFYDGSDWRIPVDRYLPQIATEVLTVRIMAASTTAPLGIDRKVNPWFGSEKPVAPIQVRVLNETIETVDLTPVP